MEREVPRVTELDDSKMMFRALTTLGFAPRATNKVQARVVQPGLGLMSRFTEAVDALQPHQYLLVAGVYPGEKTWRPTDGVLKGLGLKDDDFCAGCLDAARQDTAKKDNDPDPDGLDRYVEHDRKKQVHFQGRASNTKVQATWIARTACQLNLGSLALHVSGYHGPRALMTNLAQLLHLGMATKSRCS